MSAFFSSASSVYMSGSMALLTAFNWRCVVITMATIDLMSQVKSAKKAAVLMVSVPCSK